MPGVSILRDGDFLLKETGVNPGGHARVIRVSDTDEQPETIDPADLPQFAYQGASLSEADEASMIDFGLMALLNLGLFAGAFTAFSRYYAR